MYSTYTDLDGYADVGCHIVSLSLHASAHHKQPSLKLVSSGTDGAKLPSNAV